MDQRPADLGPTSQDWLPTVAAVGSYQEAVRRLTAENRQLRTELSDHRATSRRQVTELQAQLREGLTPELLVLRREVSRWRSRAKAAEAQVKQMRRGA